MIRTFTEEQFLWLQVAFGVAPLLGYIFGVATTIWILRRHLS